MARRMSPEREAEYYELHAFLDMYATHFRKIDPSDDAHPTNVGRRIVAKAGKSRALAGLRQTINDCLEELQDLAPENVLQLDGLLRQSGIVTLTELRRRYARTFKALLKRGRIRNETEYYMVKAILDDCAGTIDEIERTTLASLLLAFEQEHAPSQSHPANDHENQYM